MEVQSQRARLWRRLALVVPVLAGVYGTTWAVQGQPPLFPSAAECPEPAPSGSVASSPSPSASTTPQGNDRLSLSFGFQPDPLQPSADVGWNFAVTNVSQDAVTLTFATGQDGDVVLSQDGQERYRWSAGRSFTQAIRTIELAPGEAYRFTLDDTLSLEPGSYQLVATVASDPAPAAAIRTVTVGDASASESPSPSGTPDASTSPSASPSPTVTESGTDSPSPSPTTPTPSDSPSSPSATAGPVLLIPPALWMWARRKRRAGHRRGRMGTMFLVLALSIVPFGGAVAQETTTPPPTPDFEGSGGKNVVIVINQTDGRLASRAGILFGRASGPSVVPENIASATSSCVDCRTVAVAIQAVVVISDPNVASPRNAAAAVNAGCLRCETFAYAWQYVVSTGGPVRMTPEGLGTIADLRAEASSLAASDLSFPELEARLDAVAARFRAVVDQEVERVGGGQGVGERSVDVEPARC